MAAVVRPSAPDTFASEPRSTIRCGGSVGGGTVACGRAVIVVCGRAVVGGGTDLLKETRTPLIAVVCEVFACGGSVGGGTVVCGRAVGGDTAARVDARDGVSEGFASPVPRVPPLRTVSAAPLTLLCFAIRILPRDAGVESPILMLFVFATGFGPPLVTMVLAMVDCPRVAIGVRMAVGRTLLN